MLDAPRLADAIQEVGVVLRFHSSLPDTLREVAILATAGAVNCGYEWNYHVPLARRAGVPAAAIAATRTGARATELEKPTTTVIAFCRAIATHGQAPPALFAAMIAQVGRTATTELIAIAGYYALLANFIKAAGADEAVADRGC
ncbi:carboxymuconolactone decarboxylase family protein [Hephaestia sp. GCM10023244]|uniref:carboxymuconolactone decarboxylase family protein n=1 Tax=unclassified Hephaestia TaxID=2631281 RepID=UPI0020770FEC|nr:carboxymuconolactone decarboxylase family protein [Hephaestia sp. MAHUQ-44]MCM8732260.1 carboxymuconolactone decarboxylase family protein [Hephaestia sp. MAHUQ-44]